MTSPPHILSLVPEQTIMLTIVYHWRQERAEDLAAQSFDLSRNVERRVAHDFLQRFKKPIWPKSRSGTCPNNANYARLVNKSPERSFPTSLVNGRNNYNG